MTRRATIFWFAAASHVLRVIELHIETFFKFLRERPHGWRRPANAGVAN